MKRNLQCLLLVATVLLFGGGSAQAQTGARPQVAVFDSPTSMGRENPSGPNSGFFTGGSYYYLRPYFSSNPAYTVTTGAGTESVSSQAKSIDWGAQSGFSFWAGWACADGFGVRARYFFIDATSPNQNETLTPTAGATTSITGPTVGGLAPAAGGLFFSSPGSLQGAAAAAGLAPTTDLLTFSSRFDIRTYDLEAIWGADYDRWNIQVSAGGRYLYLLQGYNAQLSNSVGLAPLGVGATATETQSLLVNRQFNGAGGTMSFGTSYHVCHGLSLFGMARGSLLVGVQRQDSRFNQNISDPSNLVVPGGTSIATVQSSREHTVMPMLELEMGVEYALSLGRSRAFMRAGVANQNYFNAGSATQTGGDLGLFGVQFSAGLRY